MIREVAVVPVRAAQEASFGAALGRPAGTVAAMPGHRSHERRRGIRFPAEDLLRVRSDRSEGHAVGCRGLPRSREFRALLHRFSDPAPAVEHAAAVAAATVGAAADGG